jgi:hypothetical protein
MLAKQRFLEQEITNPLKIKNLTDDEVVVAPKAPVAVLPDKTSKTDDLVESLAALRQQASDEISQTAVWDERGKHMWPTLCRSSDLRVKKSSSKTAVLT